MVIFRGMAGMRGQFWGWFEVWGKLGMAVKEAFLVRCWRVCGVWGVVGD